MAIEGRVILVLEDEPIVGLVLEDLIEDAGGTTIYTERLAQALEVVNAGTFDAAILDVNIHGHRSYPVAEALTKRGIPFIFATGYGKTPHPDQFAAIPTVTKPYRLEDILQALDAA